LMGVVSVVLRSFNINMINEAWLENRLSEVTAIVAYLALIAYLIWDSMRGKKS